MRVASAEPPEDSAPPDPGQLARGIQVETRNGAATVSRGALRVPIVHQPVFGFSRSADAAQIELELDTCWTFGEREQNIFTLDMLEARLEDAAALTLQRAKDYPAAALGFRRALQLDPSYRIAAYHLAHALRMLKQPAAAASALAPFIVRNPARVYLDTLLDPELTPLLGQPDFAALRAQPRGTATLSVWNTDWAAYSAKYDWLAVLDPHDGLRIFVLKTAALVATLALGDRVPQGSGEGGEFAAAMARAARQKELRAKRVFDQKRPAIHRFLTDLGFVEVKLRETAKPQWESPPAYKDMVFPRSGMKLVVDGENLQLFHSERLIAAASGLDGNALHRVILLPALHTAIWKWTRHHGATDCGRQEGTQILTPTAPPAP